MAEDLPILSPAEVRVLGSLAEKKELTPDVYPMTLNGLMGAVNQKTARDPVMALDGAEVSRALFTLGNKEVVRKTFASRVERYEHLLPQKFALAHGQVALLALLMLRGPQTAYELLSRAERMARFAGIDDVKGTLDLLIGRRPPLAVQIDRGPGQREDRFAHLLSGAVELPAMRAVAPAASLSPASADGEARLAVLEERVAALEAQIKALIG